MVCSPNREPPGDRHRDDIAPTMRILLGLVLPSLAAATTLALGGAAPQDLESRLAALDPAALAAVQVDGNRLPDLRLPGGEIPGIAIVGGDARVAAISAASRTESVCGSRLRSSRSSSSASPASSE